MGRGLDVGQGSAGPCLQRSRYEKEPQDPLRGVWIGIPFDEANAGPSVSPFVDSEVQFQSDLEEERRLEQERVKQIVLKRWARADQKYHIPPSVVENKMRPRDYVYYVAEKSARDAC